LEAGYGCLLPIADIGDPQMNGRIALESGHSLSQPDPEGATALEFGKEGGH